MCNFVQPVPVEVAQGVITGYRVHVVNHSRSRKLELPASSEQFLRLPGLLPVDGGDYENLAVEARTTVGYNDSLHLDVINIHQLRPGLY